LTEGKLPRTGNEGDNVADEEVIEEFEHVAQNGGGDNFALIAGQLFLLLKILEHVGFWSGESYTIGEMEAQR
jgi:hypothetical protein